MIDTYGLRHRGTAYAAPLNAGYRLAHSITKSRVYKTFQLSTEEIESDREKAVEAGCDDYETKPIELPRLLAKIEGF
jgi:DNA-binding response OmpR family regulator